LFSLQQIVLLLKRKDHIAPLVTFRILYATVMLIGSLRFIYKGWVHSFYGIPNYFFPYYGFEWVKPLSEQGMYIVFILIAFSFFMIGIGAFYRFFSILAFLLFTYSEVIDKTNYLNHYYFISIISFVMIFLPANRYFSIDVWIWPKIKCTSIPRYFIQIIQLQLVIVYICAGVAKINYDWLIDAMPLRIWLPRLNDFPIIGSLLNESWVAYLFSWFGALYDLFIPFILMNKRFRLLGYFFVVIFHIATWLFFQIGMFPYIMIVTSLIFFSSDFHLGIIRKIQALFGHTNIDEEHKYFEFRNHYLKNIFTIIICVYFTIQVVLPFRFALYPGNLFWTEEGFRFSWRVMLIEKKGLCFFYIKDKEMKRPIEVIVSEYLTPLQESMMNTQPDMILQFAHHLAKEFKEKGMKDPQVRVLSYVSLNGKPSQLFINPEIDLAKETDSFEPKNWILPYINN
jgi:hypothetical protein